MSYGWSVRERNEMINVMAGNVFYGSRNFDIGFSLFSSVKKKNTSRKKERANDAVNVTSACVLEINLEKASKLEIVSIEQYNFDCFKAQSRRNLQVYEWRNS